ncbi:MAG: sulfatase-like hydrolase/transferase [Spirochaetes bacterium]|nr:sulfatase-like hydrolase/transferase [Spirochaetota bacterium]
MMMQSLKGSFGKYKKLYAQCIAAAIIGFSAAAFVAFHPKFTHIYGILVKTIFASTTVAVTLIALRSLPTCENLYRVVRNAVVFVFSFAIFLVIFLTAWYSICFFPDDGKYLAQISKSLVRQQDEIELVEIDLIRALPHAKITNPLTNSDVQYLLSEELRKKEFYIDPNPYQKVLHPANLKYATGRIFYYTSQKNCLVLKARSTIEYVFQKANGDMRYLEMDVVYPSFDGRREYGELSIFFNKKLIFTKKIERERKPAIVPFRYSNVFTSIWFYLRHPGRSVLPEYTGWERIKVELPPYSGVLRIVFSSLDATSFAFLGTPRVYYKRSNVNQRHLNIAYLIFDCLAKNHLDIYEFYDLFQKYGSQKAMAMISLRDRITPAVDRYFERAIIFDKMYSVGQVTRPSIVSLWTSRPYTESRLPIFRNIVTKENQEEFHKMKFATLGDILAVHGYFTKQISCNAQGHGVSSVGVDLGFDENYDYTMETSEHPENIRRILEFLQENQNRKFFLYAHINTPHSPSWVPLGYYLKALWDTDFIHSSAVVLANIRYLNSHLERIFEAAEKLGLLENTIFIISADHSFERNHKFRSFTTIEEYMWGKREPADVAYYHPRAIYTRKGRPNLYSSTMNVPFVMIIPSKSGMVPGKVGALMSTLDVAPTLLDVTLGISEKKFMGKSFKELLFSVDDRSKTFSDFIPLIGRFQMGFIYKGNYLYWRDLFGLYRYQQKGEKKYIMHPERLFDIKNDPYEVVNLIHDLKNAKIVQKMRKLYLEKFRDYPDKTYVQIVPPKDRTSRKYRVSIESEGKIIYPRMYCDAAVCKYIAPNSIIFEIEVKEKCAIVSFETDPPLAAIQLTIERDGRLVPSKEIFLSLEKLSGFGNPLRLDGIYDFHIARTPGMTGLEYVALPENSVYIYRIPLIFWLEMNTNEKDIQLNPGIKEVLRGWGYIQ